MSPVYRWAAFEASLSSPAEARTLRLSCHAANVLVSGYTRPPGLGRRVRVSEDYDAWNRLAGYGDSPEAVDVVFEYDAMGRLITQGPSKHLYYDAQGNVAWVAAMPAGADSINVWSIYSGRLLAILQGTATNWHVPDPRGRLVLTTDLAGTPKERYWGTPDGNNDPPAPPAAGGAGGGGLGGGIGGFPAASTAADGDSGMPVAWVPLGYEPQYLPVWTEGQFVDTGARIMGGAGGAWFSTVVGAPTVPPQVIAATAAKVTEGPVTSGETGGKVSVACPDGIWRRTVLVYDADDDRLPGYTIRRMLDFDAADTPVLVPFGEFLGGDPSNALLYRGNRDTGDWLAWFTNLPCTCVERMEIYGHGDPGEQNLGGNRALTKDNVGTHLCKVNWCEPCSISFAGCGVGYGDEGTGLGVAAATSTGCSVEAWTGDFSVGRLVSIHLGRKRTWNPDGTEDRASDSHGAGAHIAGIP